MNNYALEIKRLTKKYKEKVVLDNITFNVEKGTIFGVLGENGAGKTTLVECVNGLRSLSSGKVTITGRTGLQLQVSSLPQSIRALEAVKLFSLWKGVEVDEELITTFEINKLGKIEYQNMSTGQKRRLHLSLALIGGPDVIFLDEPTAGLDVEARVVFHNYIKKLKSEGKTIVLTSHDMAEVENLCGKILFIKDSKVSFLGSVVEFRNRKKVTSVEVVTIEGKTSYSVSNIGKELLYILSEFNDKGLEILELKVEAESLEKQFIDYVKDGE